LIYDREGALVHILNVTALCAWKLCDGTRSVGDIAEAVRLSFDGADGTAIQRDMEELLRQLEERGLLELTA